MPHQCTDCGRQFEDGSKEMLSGCPNCDGNKFQFLPSSASPDEQPKPASEPQQAGTDRSVARTVGNAASAVRDLVGSSSDSPPDVGAPTPQESTANPQETIARQESAAQSETVTDSSSTRSVAQSESNRSEQATASMAQRENRAQASARTELVSPDELPSRTEQTQWPGEQQSEDRSTRTGPTEQTPTDDQTDRPDLSELRDELNQQFESIKVLEPGQYELNLMELFDREEYIVALQEDGKYTVQVPEHWQD